jgi:hypothetical protein
VGLGAERVASTGEDNSNDMVNVRSGREGVVPLNLAAASNKTKLVEAPGRVGRVLNVFFFIYKKREEHSDYNLQ